MAGPIILIYFYMRVDGPAHGLHRIYVRRQYYIVLFSIRFAGFVYKLQQICFSHISRGA